MLVPMVNHKILFTALALLLYPRQTTILALLIILARTSLLFIPVPLTAVTSVLDTLGHLLLRSALLVLALHSSMKIIKLVLFWCAENIEGVLLPGYAGAWGSWIWIVGMAELAFLVCRLGVCFEFEEVPLTGV
jgi:hypothetical protein